MPFAGATGAVFVITVSPSGECRFRPAPSARDRSVWASNACFANVAYLGQFCVAVDGATVDRGLHHDSPRVPGAVRPPAPATGPSDSPLGQACLGHDEARLERG